MPKPNPAARRLLQELTPSGEDAGDSHPPVDATSRRLWALVERSLGKPGAAAAEPAAPTPEALRRLLREAQRRQGG